MMLLQKHIPLVKILTPTIEKKLKDLLVIDRKTHKQGVIKSSQQMGINILVTVDWEDESSSMVWLSTLDSIESKRFNIYKFLVENNIINEYKRLV